MPQRPPTIRRVYVDASVFGGVFDDEFAEDSRAFFDQASDGKFAILSSPTKSLKRQRTCGNSTTGACFVRS